MSKETLNPRIGTGEIPAFVEWWKNPDEVFQQFLVEQALFFVDEMMSENDIEERKKFALAFTTTFRLKLREQYPNAQPPHSDEALMQILLIIARKKVDNG